MMKRLTVIGVLAIFMTASAFACGPMPSGGGQTTSSGDTTKRQKWSKKRVQELKKRRQEQRGRSLPGGDVRGGGGMGQLGNPWLTGDEAALRRRDAIKRQQMIDAIEFLALKKERGELSPEGQKKLNALLRRVRTEGH